MKHLLTTLIFFLPLFAAGQEFAVADFALREFDLTAINEATKLVDDNGEDCALIKIETTEKGFFFDGGTIGIAKVDDNHTAEIWLYVPAGLRKITIMNNKYGVIRDYYFPVTLVSARTYLMKLRLPGQAPDKRLEQKTDSLQQQMAEMQQQMQQLMQNQQQGGAQAGGNSLKTTCYPEVIIAGNLLIKVPEDFMGEFVVGDDITRIDDWAFSSCRIMRGVTISNSVTSIGNYAFSVCTGLTSVTIPNSVTSIGKIAFGRCSGLTSVTISNSVTSIGYGLFTLCRSLTSVTIPNSVTSIEGFAFSVCTGLTSVTIPNSVTSIGDYVFWKCTGLTSVTIPNSVTSIGKSAFMKCTGLTSVTFQGANTRLGKNVFKDNNALQTIYVPKGSRAFYESQLPKKLHSLIVEQ